MPNQPAKPQHDFFNHAASPSYPYSVIMEAFAQYVAAEKPCLSSPGDVANLMRPILANQQQEHFHVLLLDSKHQLIRDDCITIGLVDRAHVHAREVYRQAIACNASRVLLVHNHPSGDPTPSAQDIGCTRSLDEAGKLLGIELLDHIIIGTKTGSRPADFLSMREMDLIK